METVESFIQPRRAARRARQGGFTAIELMVTVAVVAILAALAAPSFQQLIATQRIKSVASALTESLWVARSEALKRNDNVAFNFTNAGDNSVVGDWKITQSSDGTGPSGRLTSGGSSSIQLSVLSAGVNRWVCISASGRAVSQSTPCT
jgi:type IV fimbrial biogenesis protein FimT